MIEGHPQEIFATGTVINVSPTTLTCEILKTTGGILYNVPVLNSAGSVQGNGLSMLNNLRGSVVCYTYICGKPYIVGTVPVPSSPRARISNSSTNTGTGGDNQNTYGSSGEMAYSGGANSGWSPNDKVFSTDGGAELALFSEGGVVIKASPLAQIILGSMMDFIKVVCREFHLMTDFGELKFSHGSSGRTGLSITGGAAYGEEAQAGAGTNTVHMYLGDTPDAPESRFGVRVNSTDGADYGAFSLGKDGKLVSATSKDALLAVGEDNHIRVNGSEYHQVDGNRTSEIGGKDDVTVMGERQSSIGSNETHAVGGNMDLQVTGVLNIGAGSITITSHSGGTGPCEMKCSSFNLVKA